jgi:HSP20 family protein
MARWQMSNPFWNPLQQWSREPLWNQMATLQQELNRLFNRWGGDGHREVGLTATFPAVNVWEDAEALYVEAELPGVNKDKLEVYVTGGNQFTIKGERKPPVSEKGVWHRQERDTGSFIRVISLPVNVDQDKVDARFENGVLLVKLAKHEAAKPRKIVVKSE